MTAPELPLAAELRYAAAGLGQGMTPRSDLLREAADELVGLARQLGEVKASLTYARSAFDALTVVLEEQAETYVAAVELLRECRDLAGRARWSPDREEFLDNIDRVLAVVDRPAGQDGQ